MWGLALGILGIALALYEIATRETVLSAEESAAKAAKVRAERIAALQAGARANPRIVQRAEKCGLETLDWAKTDAWTKSYLPDALDPLKRLQMMLNVVPMFSWPMHARRVYCTYIDDGELAPLKDAVKDAVGKY